MQTDLPIDSLMNLRWLVTVGALTLLLINALLSKRTREMSIPGMSVEYPPIPSTGVLFQVSFWGVTAVALAFWAEPQLFQFVVGGFALAQLLVFPTSLRSFGLQRWPGDVSGNYKFGVSGFYRRVAAELFGISCTALFMFGFTLRLCFAGAALILASSGVGYLRRSRQPLPSASN
jgi:hypothetical protein